MPAHIITTDDLREFKEELLLELKSVLQNHFSENNQQWLKSPEVQKLLNISPGTLQHLRDNGTIPFTKIGSVLYYNRTEVMEVFEKNRIHKRF